VVFTNQSDPDYVQLLAALREGQSILDRTPRYGTPKFQPNRQYVREMKRFGILPAGFNLPRDPLDVFATDQQYWQSLWYRP